MPKSNVTIHVDDEYYTLTAEGNKIDAAYKICKYIRALNGVPPDAESNTADAPSPEAMLAWLNEKSQSDSSTFSTPIQISWRYRDKEHINRVMFKAATEKNEHS